MKQINYQFSQTIWTLLFSFLPVFIGNATEYQPRQVKAKEPCLINLDLKSYPIQLLDYVDQAFKVTSELSYINPSNKEVKFSNVQFDQVSYISIINAITDAINKEECCIAGIRIFNTLDRNSGSIKLYYVPTYAFNPRQSGISYAFSFNFSEVELDKIVDKKDIPIYESMNGNLRRINSDVSSMNTAKNNWLDYKKHIIIDKTFLPGSRSFKEGDDIYSVFFPLEEFQISQQASQNQSEVYIVSSVKKFNNRYYHFINFGNIKPEQGNYPRIPVPNSQNDVDYFINMASNMGQLCPTRCEKIDAIKIKDTDIYKIEGYR